MPHLVGRSGLISLIAGAPAPATLTRCLCLLILTLALGACDGEWCIAGKVGGLACEGDLLVHCAGGWGTFALRADRIDCRAESKYCAHYTSELSGMKYGCEESLGTCDEKSFVPYCKPQAFEPKYGDLVICQRGQLLPAGGPCEPDKR